MSLRSLTAFVPALALVALPGLSWGCTVPMASGARNAKAAQVRDLVDAAMQAGVSSDFFSEEARWTASRRFVAHVEGDMVGLGGVLCIAEFDPGGAVANERTVAPEAYDWESLAWDQQGERLVATSSHFTPGRDDGAMLGTLGVADAVSGSWRVVCEWQDVSIGDAAWRTGEDQIAAVTVPYPPGGGLRYGPCEATVHLLEAGGAALDALRIEVRQFSGAPRMTWSPDGAFLAVLDDEDVIMLAADPLRILWRRGFGYTRHSFVSPQWRTDANELAIVTGEGAWILSLDADGQLSQARNLSAGIGGSPVVTVWSRESASWLVHTVWDVTPLSEMFQFPPVIDSVRTHWKNGLWVVPAEDFASREVLGDVGVSTHHGPARWEIWPGVGQVIIQAVR